MLRLIVIAALIVVAILVLRRLFGHRPIEPFSRQPPKLTAKDAGTVTAEIDGQELEIDPAVLDEVRRLADSGQKIEAIKHLREATGLGLTEAKQIVDSLDRIHPRKA
ncbi:MAG TPA: ribosomal protein L7/L12 [Dongiaceae bacterium]|nr:ribosomal protein L7/L12 [Dongiaceae bacterium]